jgi:hypothetical protein
MTQTLNEFQTLSGSTFSKERTDDGRTVYRKNGQFTSRQAFAAGKSHTPTSEVKRGTVEASEIERTDLNEPFNTTSFTPTEAFDEGSFEREQVVESNRFYGFLQAPDTPNDRVEAALKYQEMKRRLEQSNSAEEDREIKEQYNIGGS